MLRNKEIFVCRECGYECVKWLGKCPSCGQWNTFEQAAPLSAPASKGGTGGKRAAAVSQIGDITASDDIRYRTGLSELDRVLGGGLVRGSLVLLGGDPGIGKSTLLLQVCQELAKERKVLYVSGEESAKQIKLRAMRLSVNAPDLFVLSSGDLDTILATIRQEKPDVVMVDSIQTMTLSSVPSAAGSVSQVRECANVLLGVAKENDISIILVGHVTKEGNLAGPRVLEHIVDAVFHFEGEQNHAYRILRAIKNRYGATNEIAVFEMQDNGLKQVTNPSAMLLSERPQAVSGSCVVCVLEGSRPILAEVQALITKSGFPTPRRMATGFDYNRMQLLLAVLEKRVGYFFGSLDAYINVVGGLRLDEPASDLPIALAMVSGLQDRPIPADLLAIGEIGLGGEIRSVIRIEDRVMEAQRMGFRRVLVPAACVEALKAKHLQIQIIGVATIREALKAVAGFSPRESASETPSS